MQLLFSQIDRWKVISPKFRWVEWWINFFAATVNLIWLLPFLLIQNSLAMQKEKLSAKFCIFPVACCAFRTASSTAASWRTPKIKYNQWSEVASAKLIYWPSLPDLLITFTLCNFYTFHFRRIHQTNLNAIFHCPSQLKLTASESKWIECKFALRGCFLLYACCSIKLNWLLGLWSVLALICSRRKRHLKNVSCKSTHN